MTTKVIALEQIRNILKYIPVDCSSYPIKYLTQTNINTIMAELEDEAFDCDK